MHDNMTELIKEGENFLVQKQLFFLSSIFVRTQKNKFFSTETQTFFWCVYMCTFLLNKTDERLRVESFSSSFKQP
jgi:hypothetical protein